MPDVVSLEYRVSSLKDTAKEARDEVIMHILKICWYLKVR